MLRKLDLKNKIVILRLDLNIPIDQGEILDFSRIDYARQSIACLKEDGAKTIIITHFGRPEGKRKKEFSVEFLAKVLSERLDISCQFDDASDFAYLKTRVESLESGCFLLLENIRFYEQEEENDPQFAKDLAGLGELYINDAFSCAHRAHASTVGITDFLPSYMGLAMEEELAALDKMQNISGSYIAIIAGKKVSTKFKVLQHLAKTASKILIAGAMANTFLKALGYHLGASYCEDSFVQEAKDFYKKYSDKIVLPIDLVCKRNSEIVNVELANSSLHPEDIALDIGDKSVVIFEQQIKNHKYLLWNGPLGYFEDPNFNVATIKCAKVISKLTKENKLFSVIGGGDTLAATASCSDLCISYKSTAGGAFLEYLEGNSLPGIKCLLKM